LHIEQGPKLEQAGISIGVVGRISGISFQRLHFIGKAGHAGTIAMDQRRDAAQGAAAFTLAVRRVILEDFPDCFSNVGAISLEPGYFNIISEKATVGFEFRSADLDKFRALELALGGQAEIAADQFGLGLEKEFLGEREPVIMDNKIQEAISNAAERLGLSHMPMISLAGHDAQALARVCPTGMIFVPSVDGISHSPDEYTAWDDCVNGANVLLQTALSFASSL